MTGHQTTLRPVRADDAGVFLTNFFAGDDPDPNGYLLKGGRPQTAEEVKGLVDWLVDGRESGDLHPFLFLDEVENVVGWGHVVEGDGDEPPEVLLMIGSDHRGRGHAQRALELLVSEALSGGATIVEAVVHVENAAMIHILEKVGFEPASLVDPMSGQQTWRRFASEVV